MALFLLMPIFRNNIVSNEWHALEKWMLRSLVWKDLEDVEYHMAGPESGWNVGTAVL